MITVEQAAEWLGQVGGGISDVEVNERGYVRAALVNPVDPSEPFVLIVDPMKDRNALKIRVHEVAKINRDGEIVKLLMKMNYDLICGCIGVDRDGEVMIEVNHACDEGEGEDPSPEVFRRLVEAVRETVHHARRVILHAAMVEAGVPGNVAEKVMKEHFSGDAADETEAETHEDVTL